jgi:hypothetical protein
MKLYNVTSRVVDLVWADSPEQAQATLDARLQGHGYEVMPDGVTAFLSEPVESMGWEGE